LQVKIKMSQSRRVINLFWIMLKQIALAAVSMIAFLDVSSKNGVKTLKNL